MKKVVFLSVISFLLLFACDKEEGAKLTETRDDEESVELRSEDSQVYEFYLDSLAVLEGTFALDDDSLYIAITGELTPEPGRGLIKIWGFSSKAGYLAWADAHNLPAARNLAIEEHLRNYADTSGAVSIYDSTGAIPQWYSDYEIEYLNQILFSPGEIEERGLCMLRKGCESGDNAPMLTTLPAMWPG